MRSNLLRIQESKTVKPIFRGNGRVARQLTPTHLTRFFTNNIMETPAFVYAVFLWFLLLSITGYSIYVGFGPPSKELKDPFEEHED